MKIAFCDDHTMLGEAMAVVLAARGHHVACTTTPEALIAALREKPVDICLVDLHFPEGTSIAAIPHILGACPQARVVVLSGSSDMNLFGEAIVAGASGVVSKAEDMDRIVAVVELVHAGEAVVPELALRATVDRPAEPSPVHAMARFFTTREREVLERLVRGESTATMTETMGVQYSTVRTHIQNILTKLGVHSKLEAVALAVNEGIVTVHPPVSARPPAHR